MIVLVLTKTDRIRGHSSKNTKRTAIFLHSLPTVNYLTSPRRNSLPLSSDQYSGKIQRLFTNNPKIFRDFSSTTRKYSKTFRWQNCLSRKSSVPEKNQRLSGQQQQPAAAINSSNQQQQSAAATSSGNQQQQLAAATSSSNQQQSAFILPATPTQSTPTSVSYHYGS